MIMDDRDYMVMLYDFYGELFNDKQREYFEEYYFQNLSLAEISINFGVSRNAVHKTIQGVEEKLRFYEGKLKLYEKNKKLLNIIENTSDIELRKMLEGLV